MMHTRISGRRAAFRQVDFDFVVNVARAARAAGATRLAVVSALGADPTSRIFYNRVKPYFLCKRYHDVRQPQWGRTWA